MFLKVFWFQGLTEYCKYQCLVHIIIIIIINNNNNIVSSSSSPSSLSSSSSSLSLSLSASLSLSSPSSSSSSYHFYTVFLWFRCIFLLTLYLFLPCAIPLCRERFKIHFESSHSKRTYHHANFILYNYLKFYFISHTEFKLVLREAIFGSTYLAAPLRHDLHEPLPAMLHGAVAQWLLKVELDQQRNDVLRF